MFTFLISAIVFILIFALLIIIHELGHFWAARKANVQVEEFGFGLPPKIWGKKSTKQLEYTDENGEKKMREETMEWTLNAIPFGGFVKMTGEEETKNSTSPFAFGNRPLGWRIVVVLGGVIMNFLLGWFLLTLGYGFGLNPLAPSAEQKEQFVQMGFFEEKNALFFQNVPKEISEKTGLQNMDIIKKLEGKSVGNEVFFELLVKEAISAGKTEIPLTIERFVLKTRNFEQKEITIPLQENLFFQVAKKQVVVAKIRPESRAQYAGIEEGDVLLGIDRAPAFSSEIFLQTLQERVKNGEKKAHLRILRNDEEKTIIVEFDEEGKLGIEMTDVWEKRIPQKAFVQFSSLYIPVKNVKYPWYQAPIIAFEESIRYMGLSIEMVKTLILKLIGSFTLPDEVGGVVSIAHTTNALVEYGDISKILQFVAVLSLSLAVVNIMPFPGLDGGRLVFLLMEAFLRLKGYILRAMGVKNVVIPKKIPDSWEMPLHFAGYILLLLLIAAITYKDIMRIFFS